MADDPESGRPSTTCSRGTTACPGHGRSLWRRLGVRVQRREARVRVDAVIGDRRYNLGDRRFLASTAEAPVQRCWSHRGNGLGESHRDWLQGNFYGGQSGPKKGDPCADAQGPLEHDHYFTGDGGFGSHDQNGEEVDDGDFEEIDADTVGFPSHAEEFGYGGNLGRLRGKRRLVTFEVDMPNPCVDACADAYAWAMSASPPGRGSAERSRLSPESCEFLTMPHPGQSMLAASEAQRTHLPLSAQAADERTLAVPLQV